MEPKDRIIVALDVSDEEKLRALVSRLSGHVGMFKIGLELITSLGLKKAVGIVRSCDPTNRQRIFIDGKFADIPNTVEAASKNAAALGAELFNVHVSSGYSSVRAAAGAKGASKLLAVTVLTSIDDAESIGLFGTVPRCAVEKMTEKALAAGADGVICSPIELRNIRQRRCLKVTPGVRPAWAAVGDQKRVMTPAEAVAEGADYVVIGRPITDPPKEIGSPAEAAVRIAEEIAAG